MGRRSYLVVHISSGREAVPVPIKLSRPSIAMALLIFISCVLILMSLLVARRPRNLNLLDRQWPLVGLLPSLLWNFKHLHDWATHLLILSEGTFNLVELPWMKRVFTADPGNLEYMLKTKFHSFVKGRYVKSVFRDVMGDNNLFLEDGDYFKHLSGLTISTFSCPSFRNYSIRSVISLIHDRLLPLLRNATSNDMSIKTHEMKMRRAMAMDGLLSLIGTGTASLPEDIWTTK